MCSAADFLPLCMTTFMNLASISLLNFGSGRMVRLGAAALRDMVRYLLLLGPLGAVFRPALLAVADAGTIERAAHRVIAPAGQILDAPAADQHHRVLLQVVALAADVARHLVAIGQAHARDLAQRRVRLLRRRGVHARAYAALLRRGAERRDLGLLGLGLARLTDQLTCGGHSNSSIRKSNDVAAYEKHRAVP